MINLDRVFEIDYLREVGHSARLHGNRFIQVDLGEDKLHRLHVWSDLLPTAQKYPTPIHNHPFDFTSRCGGGQLINVRYDPRRWGKSDYLLGKQPAGSHVAYQLCKAVRREGDDTTLEAIDSWAYALPPTDVKLYTKGQTYLMHAADYHATSYVGYALTVITKSSSVYAYSPSVAVPIGGKVDTIFSRYQVPESELWEIVATVCELSANEG